MNWLIKIIRFLFLVKEIKSRYGHVHFRRYRLLSTPWFSIYIHHILKSDEDKDPHDHPFNFSSLILSGAYQEMVGGADHHSLAKESICLKLKL